MSNTPIVSFIVPCYKLAHLLPECIDSILNQTYRDFEILVMDDCSPDATPAVSASFHDPRVIYVRNQTNLGHLRNYNKGISMSRGKYVWLISADDRLRRPYILERYVAIMEANPKVGYVFCSGVGVKNGEETGTLGYSRYDTCDRVVKGHVFLERLLYQNFILAASAMVRRECYEHIATFPLEAVWAGHPVDMGWLGDWYLWCMFALFMDVAYFAEPMVCYREHDLSMTEIITRPENIAVCSVSEIGMLWLIKQKATDVGLRKVSRICLHAIAWNYAQHTTSKMYRNSVSCMTTEQVEESLRRSTSHEWERRWIRGRIFDHIGDTLFFRKDRKAARQSYGAALRNDRLLLKVYGKMLLLMLGQPGDHIRFAFRFVRELRTIGQA